MSSRKRPKAGQMSPVLPEESRPEAPQADFDVVTATTEMRAAAGDAQWFVKLMEGAERTRLAEWPGKTGTGRKDDSKSSKAKPWPGAADHEVHLVQEVITHRNAARVASLARGSMGVTPMEGTDARKAGKMKTVLRYYLTTAMKSQVLVHGLRAGSWADRYGHSLMYVGWKKESAVERRTMKLGRLVEVAIEQQFAAVEQVQGSPATEAQAEQIQIASEDMVLDAILSPDREEEAAGLMLAADEGLRARGMAGLEEAKRAIRELRKSRDLATGDLLEVEVRYVSSFVKTSAPCWEALRPFVDVFYPAETIYEDNLDGARWIARIKRLSAQQLREQAVIHDWDKDWVEEVILTQRGKTCGFNEQFGTPWALNGLGTRWRTRSGGTITGETSGGETRKHLYEIVEMYDRSTTPDRLTGTFQTVFHPNVTERIGSRKLLEYWSGCYPFVAFTCEWDELQLLDSRGIPELVKGDQEAIKVQWDSRTNAASLSTIPPWTGPPELAHTQIRPGMFVESYRIGDVTAFPIPPPDGRSVEIERTIRSSVDRRFGRMSPEVPEALSMMMGQADMDWFLSSLSQVVGLTAKLIQQFMPPLKGARITGTQDTFDATPEEVRGSFDFSIKFDVRGLDIKWAEEMLKFVKDLLLPLDRKAQVQTGPLLEFGFNILDPALADRCLIPADEANAKEVEAEKQSVADIFSGGAGEAVHEGMDFETRANTMVFELKRSPMRQQMLATVPQIRQVFTARLKQYVASVKQYRDNAIIGQNMGEVALQPPSEAEQALAQLEAMGKAAPQG